MDEGTWITINGNHVFIGDKKNKDYFAYKNAKSKEEKRIDINRITFQSEDYGKYIEEYDKNRIEIFKNVLKTGKDDDYYGFKYKDISAPIILRKEKENGKYKIYDGQHRFIAYKQLGYKKVPYKFKD